jgi:hypothetical protein
VVMMSVFLRLYYGDYEHTQTSSEHWGFHSQFLVVPSLGVGAGGIVEGCEGCAEGEPEAACGVCVSVCPIFGQKANKLL